jgi:hypothetical protein
MKSTGAQLHNLLPAQPIEELGRVLMSLCVAMSSHAILLVAPPGGNVTIYTLT